MTFDEYLARNTPARHGLHVIELGEDGGTLVIPGHHSDRRTLAALNHYARDMWGHSAADDWTDAEGILRDLQRVRGIVVHACARGWGAEGEDGERPPAERLELVDPADPPNCAGCDRVGASWALLYAPDAQDHPASFLITAWEYDT